MKKDNLSAKQIIAWLCIHYGLFVLAFLSLGVMSDRKWAVILNFALDAALCISAFTLNIKLFAAKYPTPLVLKIALLFVTLCLAAFTCFAFLLPENGLPPVLFS